MVSRQSFAYPETEFYLPRVSVHDAPEGYHKGEPTGVVVCLECMRSHQNVDKIPHEDWCAQQHVHSRYYRQQDTE